MPPECQCSKSACGEAVRALQRKRRELTAYGLQIGGGAVTEKLGRSERSCTLMITMHGENFFSDHMRPRQRPRFTLKTSCGRGILMYAVNSIFLPVKPIFLFNPWNYRYRERCGNSSYYFYSSGRVFCNCCHDRKIVNLLFPFLGELGGRGVCFYRLANNPFAHTAFPRTAPHRPHTLALFLFASSWLPTIVPSVPCCLLHTTPLLPAFLFRSHDFCPTEKVIFHLSCLLLLHLVPFQFGFTTLPTSVLDQPDIFSSNLAIICVIRYASRNKKFICSGKRSKRYHIQRQRKSILIVFDTLYVQDWHLS